MLRAFIRCFDLIFFLIALYPDMRRGRSRHRDNLAADKRLLIAVFAVLHRDGCNRCWTHSGLA